MARYRKIDVRMHADAKFRQLTPPQPCGQALWWHLLAGQQTGVIPGLCSIGEAAFAEQLGWSLRGFRTSFREIEKLGMAKADFDARLVYVPNAIRYNKPESPNVIRSWSDAWDELPECELKETARAAISEILSEMGASYAQAFAEVAGQGPSKPLPKPSPKPSNKASGKPSPNQEQEQEQEQEEYPPTPQGGSGEPPLPKSLDSEPIRRALAGWLAMNAEKRRRLGPAQLGAAVSLLERIGPDRALIALEFSTAGGHRSICEPLAANRPTGPPGAAPDLDAQVDELVRRQYGGRDSLEPRGGIDEGG